MRKTQQPRSLEETVQELQQRLLTEVDDYERVYSDLIAARAALAARNEVAEEEAKHRRRAFVVLRGTSLGAIPAALAGGYRWCADRMPGSKGGKGRRLLTVAGGATVAAGAAAAAALALTPPAEPRAAGGNVPTAAPQEQSPRSTPTLGASPGAPNNQPSHPSQPTLQGGATPIAPTEPEGSAAPTPPASGSPGTPGPAPVGKPTPPSQAPPGTGAGPGTGPGAGPGSGAQPGRPEPPKPDKPEPPKTQEPPTSKPTPPGKKCLLKVRLDPLLRLRICLR